MERQQSKNEAFLFLCAYVRESLVLIYVLSVSTLNSMGLNLPVGAKIFLAYRQTDRFRNNSNRRAVSRDLIPMIV